MMGEELTAADVREGGLIGDRAYALIDNSTGKIASAKNPRTAPDSPALEEYWPDIDGLAHRETVTEESIALSSPKGSFFDYAVAHIITTNTLNRLRELYPQGRFEARRFRPNIIVTVGKGEADFVENSWVGLSVEIGETLLLVTNPCARCVMTTLPQADLPQDHGILRTAAQHNQPFVPALGQAMPSVGVYANVLRAGTVRRGDPVRVQ